MTEMSGSLATRHDHAVLDAEARRLAHTLMSYGALGRAQLLELSGAQRWSRGRFSHALSRAVDDGLIRYLGHGFYAPPRDDNAPARTPRRSADGYTATRAYRPPSYASAIATARISSRDMGLDQSDFEHLLELRSGLRRFLSWSEEQAKEAGLTPAKHQLLLAIQGHPDPAGPTIGDLAEHLVLRHHSVVGLVDRAERDGLVKRTPDAANRSVVRVNLTAVGEAKLDALTEAHLQEIRHLAPTMRALWRAVDQAEESAGSVARGTKRAASTD